MAAKIINHRRKTLRELNSEIVAREERRERANQNIVDDVVDDAFTAFNNLPGCRGGSVSFGGI